jgi:5,10-methylenetetrahydrofolate reductase
MKISFEIVPRNAEAFAEQYAFAQSLGDTISLINVPDIQRFAIRSWDTGRDIDRNQHGFIPHFRSIDFDLKSGEIYRIIEQNQLDHVLLVTGDPPEGLKRSFHNTSVVDLIRQVKQRFPQVDVYAGFDSHRGGVQDEINYIKRKADAGATGFFSQPFYDLRMIEIYAEQMQGLNTYIGLSPITTESSMHYWEVKNQVQFPVNFRPDYDWNVDFSNRVIKFAADAGLNIYFMPIRIKLEKYFGRLELPA